MDTGLQLDLTGFSGKFSVAKINPANGALIGKTETLNAGKKVTMKLNNASDIILRLRKI